MQLFVVRGLAADEQLQQLRYGHELTVDLGVGLWAWPLPLDFDRDGDLDLVVVCPDKPSNGTWFFENPGGGGAMPVFKAGVRVSAGMHNVQVSYVGGQPVVLSPGKRYPKFLESGLADAQPLGVPANFYTSEFRRLASPRVKVRANQWKLADLDGDGHSDLVTGIGDWSDYGWDDAYDSSGRWTNGPLHGLVFWWRNGGTDARPQYEPARQVEAGGQPVDVYGMPSPNFADFDGDGDLDLLCGEFVDSFTYFENRGDAKRMRLAAGRPLGGQSLRMPLCMITPVAVDWDRDGDVDLVVGQEDGRVGWLENSGEVVEGMPQFKPLRFFQQQAAGIKFGALATPVGADWDGDGDDDILCGNTAGEIGWIENLGSAGGDRQLPRFAAPRLLQAGGKTIRIQAGSNGSIQGPCEAKWGYTTLSVGDWDHDGLLDLVANSIWGRVVWYRNIGRPGHPELAPAEPIRVAWPGETPAPAWNWWRAEPGTLVTQWRTTPLVVDWDRDGLNDLVMLDHEGYLAWFARKRRGDELVLEPGRRVFADGQGRPLRLNDRSAGGSGRRKLWLTDWDGDGLTDLLVNSVNADWLKQVGQRDGRYIFESMGPLDDRKLAGHTSSPTVVDWNRDGIPDLLVGAEDGYLYYVANPRSR